MLCRTRLRTSFWTMAPPLWDVRKDGLRVVGVVFRQLLEGRKLAKGHLAIGHGFNHHYWSRAHHESCFQTLQGYQR
jgi:hypothetical protein